MTYDRRAGSGLGVTDGIQKAFWMGKDSKEDPAEAGMVGAIQDVELQLKKLQNHSGPLTPLGILSKLGAAVWEAAWWAGVKMKAQQKTASYQRVAAMEAGKWYHQQGKDFELWFLAQGELKNGGFAGKQVEWTSRKPKAKNSTVPKSFGHLWKEISPNDVPDEVKAAV